MTTLITEVQQENADAQMIFDAMATRYGYTGFTGGDGLPISPDSEDPKFPQTKQQFLQNWILKKVYSEAAAHITAAAGAAAANTKQAELDSTLKDEIVK